jgi:folate-binding protein YgfZ
MTDARRCTPDPDRTILRLTGPDRVKFLQGLATNDLGRLPAAGILYAALLTPQGKYLTDFFLIQAPEAILLDAPAAAAEDLRRRLSLYRLRAQVEIAPADLPVTRGLGPAPAGALADPRDPGLGWRLYGAALTEGVAPDWDALHVALRVPQHGRDLIPNDSFILEHDFERLHGVDFRKGCYVGQEVTARMRHRAELRRGLVTLALDAPVEPGTPVTTADGREAGRIGTVAGTRALALLRRDRLAGPLSAGGVAAWPETVPQA